MNMSVEIGIAVGAGMVAIWADDVCYWLMAKYSNGDLKMPKRMRDKVIKTLPKFVRSELPQHDDIPRDVILRYAAHGSNLMAPPPKESETPPCSAR